MSLQYLKHLSAEFFLDFVFYSGVWREGACLLLFSSGLVFQHWPCNENTGFQPVLPAICVLIQPIFLSPHCAEDGEGSRLQKPTKTITVHRETVFFYLSSVLNLQSL